MCYGEVSLYLQRAFRVVKQDKRETVFSYHFSEKSFSEKWRRNTHSLRAARKEKTPEWVDVPLIQLAAYRRACEENLPDQPLEGGFHMLGIGNEDASSQHHHWGLCPGRGRCSAICWRSTGYRRPSMGKPNGKMSA
jgi:hypothetical protein